MKKALRYLLYAVLALLLTAALAVWLIARVALAPGTDEWRTQVQVGPVTLDVGVPTAIRLATSSWFAPWLDGRTFDTAHGPVRLGWDDPANTLELRCTPCSISLPALGSAPVRVDSLRVTARRDAGSLSGLVEAAPTGAGPAAAAGPDGSTVGDGMLHARWDGRLSQKSFQLHLDAADAPIERWYAVLAPGIPELKQARITGTLGLRSQIDLPAGSFTLLPRISQFQVEGLGTEAVLGARSSCGPPARLAADSWLARAVLAAEDQRFFGHPGYDLGELSHSLEGNQKAGHAERGGSTLTQQLARLLATGADRSLERKLRELLYAVEMEQTLGKARILQLYLDNAPWGADVCGAEAASRRYFKRSARNLEPAQAVWLAAMLHAPQRELEKWQRDGSIDAARAKWVADGIRGISRERREALAKTVANARFAAP